MHIPEKEGECSYGICAEERKEHHAQEPPCERTCKQAITMMPATKLPSCKRSQHKGGE